MNTTVLFAELLIIGLESSLWLLFLALTFFGNGWFINITPQLKEWQTILTVIVLPILYVFGIIIDRVSDSLFERWNSAIKKKALSQLPKSVNLARFRIGKDYEFLSQQIEYTRSRMRIVRASSVNFALITIFSTTYIVFQTQTASVSEKIGYVAFTIIMGSLLTLLSMFTWKSLTLSRLKMLEICNDVLTSDKKQDSVRLVEKKHA